MIKKDIFIRLMIQANQVALDSCILPLALHFEPEEIAAACINVAQKMFRIQKPKFTNPSITSKAKDINIAPAFLEK